MKKARFPLILTILMVLTMCSVVQNAVAANTVYFGSMISENRQFSSDWYSFPQGHPWANEVPRWFMIGSAIAGGDQPYPVNVTSARTGSHDLTYNGPYLNFQHLSVDGFVPDYLYGSFDPPGSTWEDTLYPFTIGPARYDWYIPADSLVQLPTTGPVTVTPGEHPTFTWNAVAGADAYDIQILPMNYARSPLFTQPLFSSGNISEDGSPTYSYTYTGDLFEKGIDYPVIVRALQYHPYSGTNAQYNNQVLNRSTRVLKHRGHTPEDLSTWSMGTEGASANFAIDSNDSSRYFMECTSTNEEYSKGEIQKTIEDAIGIIADVTVLTVTTSANSDWAVAGLRLNVADTSRGTYIVAQIRTEWSGGNQHIHCRVRERKADGSMYQDIVRVNQAYGWGPGLTVPMGIAVVSDKVVFWAEGRGSFAVPLPSDITYRNDPMSIFMSVDPGATTLNAMVDNVRVATEDNPLVFGEHKESEGCDINGDGKIGVEEAIAALQVVVDTYGK